MSTTPPPLERRKTIYRNAEGTPLPFNQTSNGNPAQHRYKNNTIPNTPSGPRASRKRTRIRMNNNNPNNNNDYIPPQIVVSTTIQSLREDCEEHIKNIDLKHRQLIDDLIRDKKYEIDNINEKYKEDIDNINKEYEEKINEKNTKNERKKANLIVQCEELEKIVKIQEKYPERKILFPNRRTRRRTNQSIV